MNRTYTIKLVGTDLSLGIIADLDVAHVFNVTYVDCNLFVFS